MIKVFKHNETDFSHNENALDDVYFCEVSEELNGQYDVNLEASIIYESILTPECIVTVPTQRGIQPFRIKQVTKTLRGLEAWGQHLFFDLADHFIEDKRPTDTTGQGALSTILEGTGYTGVSNNPTVGTAYYIRKTVVDALLAVDNSYLNVWGGILVRNGKKVTALGEGLDRGYSVRLGENLLGLEYTVDNAGIVTRVYPTAVLDNLVFELPEKQIDAVAIGNYYRPKSRELRVELPDSVTTKEDAYPIMRAEAVKFLTAQSVPVLSASFDFIELSKTDEYKGFQILEQLDIGDIVYCDVPTHGIKLSASLVAYVYDSLKDRYISVTVGSVKPSTVSAMSQFKAEIVQEATEIVQSKVTEAINGVSDTITDRITGVNGGNIVIRYTADGKPYELLVMDTDDVNTATEVIRLNKEGMAFSVNGINGPFAVAMTAKDGLYAEYIHGLKITADMIEAGSIGSDHLAAGSITADHIGANSIDSDHITAGGLDARVIKLTSGETAEDVGQMQTKIINGEVELSQVTDAKKAAQLKSRTFTGIIPLPPYSAGDTWATQPLTHEIISADGITNTHQKIKNRSLTHMDLSGQTLYVSMQDRKEGESYFKWDWMMVGTGEKYYTEAKEGITENRTLITQYGVLIEEQRTNLNSVFRDVTRIEAGQALFVKHDDLGKVGATLIDGGNVSTGRIQSLNNSSYWDLDNNSFNLGGKLTYSPADGLKLNGQFSATEGTRQALMRNGQYMIFNDEKEMLNISNYVGAGNYATIVVGSGSESLRIMKSEAAGKVDYEYVAFGNRQSRFYQPVRFDAAVTVAANIDMSGQKILNVSHLGYFRLTEYASGGKGIKYGNMDIVFETDRINILEGGTVVQTLGSPAVRSA